jgi:CBS domain-containing protein
VTGLTRFPVVERTDRRKLVGIIALTDLLKARARNLEAEHRRERVLPVRLILPWSPRRAKRADVA